MGVFFARRSPVLELIQRSAWRGRLSCDTILRLEVVAACAPRLEGGACEPHSWKSSARNVDAAAEQARLVNDDGIHLREQRRARAHIKRPPIGPAERNSEY
jgi:hypothetical protein